MSQSSRRSAAASALADLFFKSADEASVERTNQMRVRYRLWRQGDEAAGPHADVLALEHAASTDQKRSSAKMKRVRVGDFGPQTTWQISP